MATLRRRIGDALIEKGLTLEKIAHLTGHSGVDVTHPFRPAGPLLTNTPADLDCYLA